jgi:hypothetical protein
LTIQREPTQIGPRKGDPAIQRIAEVQRIAPSLITAPQPPMVAGGFSVSFFSHSDPRLGSRDAY